MIYQLEKGLSVLGGCVESYVAIVVLSNIVFGTRIQSLIRGQLMGNGKLCSLLRLYLKLAKVAATAACKCLCQKILLPGKSKCNPEEGRAAELALSIAKESDTLFPPAFLDWICT